MKFDVGVFAGYVKRIAPIVLLEAPQLAPLVRAIIDAVIKAEAIPSATGADKLRAAVDESVADLHVLNAALGRVVVDPTLARPAIEATVSAIVDAVNRGRAHAQATPAERQKTAEQLEQQIGPRALVVPAAAPVVALRSLSAADVDAIASSLADKLRA